MVNKILLIIAVIMFCTVMFFTYKHIDSVDTTTKLKISQELILYDIDGCQYSVDYYSGNLYHLYLLKCNKEVFKKLIE